MSSQHCTAKGKHPLYKEFPASHGLVTGVTVSTLDGGKSYCYWKLKVPENYNILLKAELTLCYQTSSFNFRITYSWSPPRENRTVLLCPKRKSAALMIHDNVAKFELVHLPNKATQFTVSFTSVRERHPAQLPMVMTSAVSGYITSPGYNGRDFYSPMMFSSRTIFLHGNHTVVISFEKFTIQQQIHSIRYVDGWEHCNDGVVLARVDSSSQETTLWIRCGKPPMFPEVYNHSLRIHFASDNNVNDIGFKMKFSFHKYNQSPKRLVSGLFNCSVSYYPQFKDHVDCNMKQECEGREDERGHCPFSSPACDGSVAVHDKCYSIYPVKDKLSISVTKMKDVCESHDSVLAMMKTVREWEALYVIYDYKEPNTYSIVVGMTTFVKGMPHYYRKSFLWLDRSVDYIIKRKGFNPIRSNAHQANIVYGHRSELRFGQDSDVLLIICESHQTHSEGRPPDQNEIPTDRINMSRKCVEQSNTYNTICVTGHFTANYLACHFKSHCGATSVPSLCHFRSHLPAKLNTFHQARRLEAVATFLCELSAIPYSFVCDFFMDCRDGSDEDFCVHGQFCLGFKCRNEQCIERHRICDTFKHCQDGSDEDECHTYQFIWAFQPINTTHPPAMIDFDGTGHFQQTPMHEAQLCPDTHFRCTGELNYCLPVYVRCNGVYDCMDHEDEAACVGDITCPGYYRCWDSNICVHPDHMCDGWPQCPRQDDELLCNFTCPQQCRCQGLAFVCHQPFPAQDFPDLRYLDASGSGMRLEQLMDNYYLILIKLQACKLEVLPLMIFKNLITLNAEENLLTAINVAFLSPMNNLQILKLAGNPLVTISQSNSSKILHKLHCLDISRSKLTTFDSFHLTGFSNVQELNVSFSTIKTIAKNGFTFFTRLRRLDISGNSITHYPRNVFKSLTLLRHISASDFKFCCRANLPDIFISENCISPTDEISSCEDLLRSGTYRSFLWLISIMSMVGNVGSLLFRVFIQKAVSKSGFHVFVTNLCLADFLMGVYLAIVGVADALHRGEYLWYQTTWMSSVVCHTAGCLSLLSNEVSALTICLITVDRFVVLRFPFTNLKFGRKSAGLASLTVWIAGMYYLYKTETENYK